jgi:hypothetical protein
MTFKDKFDDSVGVAEHVCLIVCPSHLIFKIHRGRCRVFLAQARDIPNTNRLVEGGRYDQIVFGVKLSAPNVYTKEELVDGSN